MFWTNDKANCIRNFVHFRRASIGFVMAVCPSVRKQRKTRLSLKGILKRSKHGTLQNMQRTKYFPKSWQAQWVIYIKTTVYNKQTWEEFFLQKETVLSEFEEKTDFVKNISFLVIQSFMKKCGGIIIVNNINLLTAIGFSTGGSGYGTDRHETHHIILRRMRFAC
jgi:hypothetical protein